MALLGAAILFAGAIAGCAGLRPAGAAPAVDAAAVPTSAPASGPARTAAVPPPAPGQPPPFATVIKDAKKIDGLLTLWQRDDKVWIELKPQDFGKPLFFGPRIAQGIGERRLYGGSSSYAWDRWGRQQVVEFKRVHQQVQLLARNTSHAPPRSPAETRSLLAAYSPSLIASSVVASQPHPQSKAILIDANPIFLSDLQGIAMRLQAEFRQGYGFDARHSAIAALRGTPDAVVIEVAAHYATANISKALPSSPGPAPTVPLYVPDARSLFFGLNYTLSSLPGPGYAPRQADPRVGYFTTTVTTLQDRDNGSHQHLVNRWRLEKVDPAATLSEPVKPITFWLDRSIPEKYREAVRRGILEWNKAFERIGFKNAVVAKMQPDDAAFDTMDSGVTSVRWMTNAQPSFVGVAQPQIDPRTGEILDVDIALEDFWSRDRRRLRTQVLGPNGLVPAPAPGERMGEPTREHEQNDAQCDFAEQASVQLEYALSVMEARGELDPDSPQAERWVQDFITDVTLHEVGHALGLRHNFRSSRIYSEQQLGDESFTRERGIAGSVMDYQGINLPAPGQGPTTAFQLVLGPYDLWAIEYGYKPLPANATPEQEQQELQRIAARSAEPELAYGTDEDALAGADPEVQRWDLGNDPVAFAAKRIAIANDLLRRQQTRMLRPDQAYNRLRRSVAFAINDMALAASVAVRQVGGVRALRDFPGSGREPFQPVPADAQRAALKLLTDQVLAVDAFVLPAALQRRLAPDFLEFSWSGPTGADAPLGSALTAIRASLLSQLMSDGVAQRLLDSRDKLDRPGDALSLAEVYEGVRLAVWRELDGRNDISAPGRDLQREHVNRIAGILLRPSALTRADARSLMRSNARSLLARIDAAKARKGLSPESRAHLEDSAQTLRQALQASLQRVGV
jgi:hypothetical protein